MELVAWIFVAILWLLGIIGVFHPILPGSTLVMVSAWMYFLISPSPYPWWIATCATAVWAVGSFLDSLAAVLSAKIMGSSNWGVVGAAADGVGYPLVSAWVNHRAFAGCVYCRFDFCKKRVCFILPKQV